MSKYYVSYPHVFSYSFQKSVFLNKDASEQVVVCLFVCLFSLIGALNMSESNKARFSFLNNLEIALCIDFLPAPPHLLPQIWEHKEVWLCSNFVFFLIITGMNNLDGNVQTMATQLLSLSPVSTLPNPSSLSASHELGNVLLH